MNYCANCLSVPATDFPSLSVMHISIFGHSTEAISETPSECKPSSNKDGVHAIAKKSTNKECEEAIPLMSNRGRNQTSRDSLRKMA
jgi:hypothetical protein